MIVPFNLSIPFSILLLASHVSAGYIPSPYPSATALPSPTTIPLASPTAAPLVPRCNDGACTGGTATTLQASVVTSTILSITSVPCYITTFVTNSQTVTSTMYNTATVTETQTKEGKVYIVLYEPKPIVKSTVVQKVVQVTVEVESYWVESTGVAGTSTIREEWTTMGGGGRPDCPTCMGAGQPAQPQSQGGPAWTHVSAPSAANTAPTGKSQSGDGWAAAAGGGVVVGGEFEAGSGTGTTWDSAGVNGQGTWTSAASPGRVANDRLGAVCLALAVGVLVLGELLDGLRA